MTDCVFHYTDTIQLPWILDEGELKPGPSSRVDGYPIMDFVWATTNEEIARSASAFWNSRDYENGETWKVRFTLSADDFEPWQDAVTRLPGWADDHTRLVHENTGGDEPGEWRTHLGSLPRSRWLAIHARSYLCSDWREISCDLPVRTEAVVGEMARIGRHVKRIRFAAREFISYRLQEQSILKYGYETIDLLQCR